MAPDSGHIEVGTTVKLGYLDQQTSQLDPGLKVIEALREVAECIPLANGQQITAAQMLERFLFPGRLQHTLVGRLSGGERRRLYLLQILIGNPNVLFLDEPTNDLDIPTLSCLEDYLDSYGGSLVVSSHDRYFLDRTVTSLLVFENGSAPRPFTGSYSDFEASRKQLTR
jgi:ATP-binding cassette subfamily F protein uup